MSKCSIVLNGVSHDFDSYADLLRYVAHEELDNGHILDSEFGGLRIGEDEDSYNFSGNIREFADDVIAKVEMGEILSQELKSSEDDEDCDEDCEECNLY